jgi:hypothetical protein
MSDKIDWEKIEAEYRAGQFSVSEIARQNGVSHTAINKRAKRDGWERDLAPKVRQRVSARLVSEGVSAATARETIELAAERDVQIVREHRAVIGRGRNLTLRMLDELDASTTKIGDLEALIEADTEGDESARRRDGMMKAISLPSRAGTLKDLSMAAKNWLALERQAFNIDDNGTGDQSASALIVVTDTDRAKALAAFVAKTKGGHDA